MATCVETPVYWTKPKSLPLYLKPLNSLVSVPIIPDYWSISIISSPRSLPSPPPHTHIHLLTDQGNRWDSNPESSLEEECKTNESLFVLLEYINYTQYWLPLLTSSACTSCIWILSSHVSPLLSIIPILLTPRPLLTSDSSSLMLWHLLLWESWQLFTRPWVRDCVHEDAVSFPLIINMYNTAGGGGWNLSSHPCSVTG